MSNLAYAQVYQLLQYIPQNEYEKIPKEQIDFIKAKMGDANFKFYDINSNIENVELSLEAKNILLNLYYLNFASEKQKEKLDKYIYDKDKEQNDIMYKEMFNKPSPTPQEKAPTPQVEDKVENKVENLQTSNDIKPQSVWAQDEDPKPSVVDSTYHNGDVDQSLMIIRKESIFDKIKKFFSNLFKKKTK